jgi:hypothetical protein
MLKCFYSIVDTDLFMLLFAFVDAARVSTQKVVLMGINSIYNTTQHDVAIYYVVTLPFVRHKMIFKYLAVQPCSELSSISVSKPEMTVLK